MDREERRSAKLRLVTAMRQGQPWQVAAETAGFATSRATAYRLRQRVDAEGEAAVVDGRHGHPKKVRAPVRAWLVEQYRAAPETPSRVVQPALRERFGLEVSISQLNRVRAALGVGRPRRGRGGKMGHRRSGRERAVACWPPRRRRPVWWTRWRRRCRPS